jgi:hypothetical protein
MKVLAAIDSFQVPTHCPAKYWSPSGSVMQMSGRRKIKELSTSVV